MSAFYDKILDYKKRKAVYVIAEVGSNYKSHTDLMNSVSLAKACGADAVKFQYFTRGELYGPAYELDQAFPLRQLKEKADAVGIDFLCTAFSPEGLHEVDQYVVAHKIASSEMAFVKLLDAAVETGKPIILSTGGYFETDIKRTLAHLKDHEVILMHCNHAYPAKHADLKKFDKICKMVDVCGYSDHTTSIDIVPLFFQERGVTVYEKHFNPFGYVDTPDGPHSLNVDEFKCMVSHLRGSPNDFSEEGDARLMHVRRVVALTDLAPGDILKDGVNMGVFRAQSPDARGVNPFAQSKLEGKTVGVNVPRGAGISFSDLK